MPLTRWLLLIAFIATPVFAQHAREPWEWTTEERVRARMQELARTGILSSSVEPRLIYPSEHFEVLIRRAFVFSPERNPLVQGQLSVDILTTDEEWEELAKLSAVYVDALKSDLDGVELCELRMEALERARERFGRVEFDRFLYRTGGIGIFLGGPQEVAEEHILQELDFVQHCKARWLPLKARELRPPGPIKVGDPRRAADECKQRRGDRPVVLDFRSGAYRVSRHEGGVSYDLDGDGSASQSAWPVDTLGVAFLIYDRNRNGIVDGASELLSNRVPLKNGRTARSGLWLLRSLDCDKDGLITKDDCTWKRLGLWYDVNRDGYTDLEEIVSFEAAGLVSIETGYSWVGRDDGNGNRFMNKGWFRYLVDGVETRRAMFEVCLGTGE